jgi:DNA invertase Pin-like site-specific DNA recombinase
MTAIAYLRRSRVDARKPGTMSHEQQLAAVHDLAKRHGDTIDDILEDWGKSGRAEKQHLRAGFTELVRRIEAGEVSAVYSYSMSRLARSMETMAKLNELCRKRGIPIRCADGYSPDVSTATGLMVANILGSVNEWQANWTKERAVEGIAIRRARGERLGPPPPEPGLVTRIAETFAAEGTILATVKRLNREGVPTRRGGDWQASTVLGILRRDDPTSVPLSRLKRGRPATRQMRLSGLLRCSCGTTLTGHERPDRRGFVSYECKSARNVEGHPQPASVAESKLIDWTREEAARLRTPKTIRMAEQASRDSEARRELLVARRARVTDAYLDGTIDKERREAEFEAIDRELDALEARSIVTGVPAIDWSKEPKTINAVLRAMWEYIELDGQLRPVGAEWLVPEWRAA